MRRALVDHAREVGAQKRGGKAERISLESAELSIDAPAIDLIDLGRALEDLEAADPRLVEIIELKFFSELTDEEVAEALDLSRATVQREWAAGKRVLAQLLSEGKGREA
jgi:RNA polymerase sigma factor (TIGR02999 family)